MDGPDAEHQSRLAAGDPLALKWERRHATAESARIRRELIAWADQHPFDDWRDRTALQAALNRICPEEPT